MGKSNRAWRAFRPTNDALEGRNAASSLVLSLPTNGSAVIGRTEPSVSMPVAGRVARTLVAPRSADSLATRPSSTVILVRAEPRTNAVAAGATVTTLPTLDQPREVMTSKIPARSFQPLTPANPLPSSPAPRSDPSGSGSNPAMSSTGVNGIRPMSVAPSVATGGGSAGRSNAPALFLASSSTGGHSTIHPDFGPPQNPTAPSVYYSGGAISGRGSGTVNISGGVPIGTQMSFGVNPDSNFTVASITWAGGSGYSSYFTDPASTTVAADPSLQKVSVGTNVPTNTANYAFIVTPQAAQYSVKVNVSYVNPNGGAPLVAPPTTVTFNAVSPIAAKITPTDGYWASYSLNGNQWVGYSDNNQPWNNISSGNHGLGKGIVLTATTQPSATFGGNFMFTQTMNAYYGYTLGGVSRHFSNSGTGANLDDGYPGSTGLPIGTQGAWTQPAGAAPATNTGIDPPVLGVDSTTGSYANINSSFTTYLMYTPGSNYSGVWIALYQVKWSVNVTATSPNWGIDSATAAPASIPSATSGAGMFPGWTYNISALNWQSGL